MLLRQLQRLLLTLGIQECNKALRHETCVKLDQVAVLLGKFQEFTVGPNFVALRRSDFNVFVKQLLNSHLTILEIVE